MLGAWPDTNGDGLRQPRETPLAGIQVTAGQTTVTDRDERFTTIANIAEGTHQLVAALPDRLTAVNSSVMVSAGRGAAVGIAAIERRGWSLYLPVVS